MNKIKAVVVDDEYECRQTLVNFLTRYCPEVSVAGEGGSVAEAVVAIETLQPDILFLDINMPEENGFQLFSKLKNKDFYTVFVTAYDQYALQAFKHHAVDYLLKPINIHELIATVNRVGQLARNKNQVQQLSALISAFKHPAASNKIALPVLDGLIYVRTEDIVRCEASSNYTYIHFEDGKKIVASRTLGVYEEILKDKGFVRIHHQHLINLRHLEKYVRGRGGTALMSDGKEIQVSQRKKEEFIKHLTEGTDMESNS